MEINYFAVILSFLLNLLKRYSSKICSFLLSKYNPIETQELRELKSELDKLKEEKITYNPIDQFALYALVDRKINKIVDKIQELKNTNRSARMKYTVYLNVILTVIVVFLSIFLIWSNYNDPIIDLNALFSKNKISNEDTAEIDIFYPLNRFFSFPSTHRKNTIGVTAWLFIVNRFIDIVLNKLSCLYERVSHKNN
jgi:hypothetical protein